MAIVLERSTQRDSRSLVQVISESYELIRLPIQISPMCIFHMHDNNKVRETRRLRIMLHVKSYLIHTNVLTKFALS
jgi:hypothetical protein